ncbi:hypothetical protein PHLGIDRAFT_63885 [Phlebiopsis gigantea 11061_1 CR5-6]|uniref:6-phosphogluconolactonase n=1 Tax=Phlebiopsis gigantea (strain 11061_1 CR5-6) TaxID=745531 RepID=A0A0C3SF58_PHLG1|nr:hypothetical protein PHLGIDRAFT_63885 [Phlebiopsis gigantea 11061_1 CR5-6]
MSGIHAPSAPILCSFSNPDELVDSLAQFIVKAQKEAVQKKGRFTVAISGGSLPQQLSGLIGRPGVKWDKWQVYYADERIVPLDHADSNHRLCEEHLWSKVPIPKENIHTIDSQLIEAASAEPAEDAEDALEEIADAYEQELIHEFANKDSARFPIFDLILLGVGPDGHIGSLFPGHALLSEDDRWVAYITDSPKPPPRRFTLTFPVINHAARVAFVASGAGKADTLHTVLDKPEVGLPASRVRPSAPGQVYWFVDDAAAAKVEYPRTQLKL